MANQWLRLWHDMPNDPKWRTIARASKQSISKVMAVYIHLLVEASVATERGTVQINEEDLASALDVEAEQVASIVKAMQGRVLEGNQLLGWRKRQPLKEDGSAQRAKAWREKKKQIMQNQPNENEHQDKEKDKEKDTDKEKEKEKEKEITKLSKNGASFMKKFAMHASWQPDSQFKDLLLNMGFTLEQTLVPQAIFAEFTSFWLTKPEIAKTQEQWHHALMQSYQYAINRGKADATRTRAAKKIVRTLEDTATDTQWWGEQTL